MSAKSLAADLLAAGYDSFAEQIAREAGLTLFDVRRKNKSRKDYTARSLKGIRTKTKRRKEKKKDAA